MHEFQVGFGVAFIPKDLSIYSISSSLGFGMDIRSISVHRKNKLIPGNCGYGFCEVQYVKMCRKWFVNLEVIMVCLELCSRRILQQDNLAHCEGCYQII